MAAKPKLDDDPIGTAVVVRDDKAGVFVGTLRAFDAAAKTCTLADARKIWFWRGAAAVEGLATKGCNVAESKITPRVKKIGLCAVVQVLSAEPEAAKKLLEAPEWTP